jgi:guanylate kinase
VQYYNPNKVNKQVSREKNHNKRSSLNPKTAVHHSIGNNKGLFNPETRPLLIIISGPSGAGKDTVLNRMRKSSYPIKYITTVTTRPQRSNEKNNLDYHFISLEKFEEMVENDELLEKAKVYGNWYGVPKKPVIRALNEGYDVILKVDIQGAATFKKMAPQAVFIFLLSSSIAELATRLQQRHTESTFDLAIRLRTAKEEIKQLQLFEYIVFNQGNKIDRAVSDITAIIAAEKCRVNPKRISLSS